MPTKLNNLKYLKDTRIHLRRNLTEAELILWKMLKTKNINGKKFRRQHSIGFYIADFYCPSDKVVIELDGQHHYTHAGKEKDLERDDHLASMGIKVLRFENKEILNNLTGVLNIIKANLNLNKPV